MAHWWEHNLNKLLVAAGLATMTLLYYFLFHEHDVAGHFPAHYLVSPVADGPNMGTAATVLSNAILAEFIPFIVLLFSLYTITGGIRLEGDLPAHSLTNTAFLAIGGVLASIIGTTGAAMLLVRPLLETNRERKHVKHTVIFFIFIVCNCGGLLLPTGDPPLFLGYLMGVPFLWTLGLWKEWLFINGCLLAIYFVWDHFFCYPHETKSDVARDETEVRPLKIQGLMPNAILLLGVVATAGLLDPSKPLVGTDMASVGLLAGDDSIGIGGRVPGRRVPRRTAGEQLQLRRNSGSGRACSSASSSACSPHCRSSMRVDRDWD